MDTNEIRLFIVSKSNNIGALCNFLKNEKNSEYLNFILESTPDLPTLPERLYYLINDLVDLPTCDCGKLKKFIGFKNGWRETCGDYICVKESRKKTNLVKYGVENPMKNIDILNKSKSTSIHRYGVEHPMKSETVKNKFNKTMIDRFGVEWAQQNKDISKKSFNTFNLNSDKDSIIKKRSRSFKVRYESNRDLIENKKRETKIKKWGSLENYNNNIKEKIKEKSIEKWGVEHHLSSPEIIDKRVLSYKNNTTNKIVSKLPITLNYINRSYNNNLTDVKIDLKCLKCQNIFTINRQLLYMRVENGIEPCLNCNPILSGKSLMESDIVNWIKSIYIGDVLTNVRNLISNEIDIYLPEIKLAIEFNGLYWHSDEYKEKNYHLNKTIECRNLNIKLVHIWEDDWLYKKEIVKSIISNKIGKSNSVFARKCSIKEVDSKTSKYFLDKNHIQLNSTSSVKIGLYYDGELISIMTFSKLRKSLGNKSIKYNWEMIRFCNKIGYSVTGGASKLLSYFIKKYKPKTIVSYSDSSRGDGNLYQKLGFEFSHETDPNYYWVIDGIRKHRFLFRKDRLIKMGYDKDRTEVQIMWSLGWRRIFDCGSKKWILNF